MKTAAIIIAVSLIGCADEAGPTLGDAAEEVAFGLCSRWITCGTTDEQWQECVADLVWDFCKDGGKDKAYNCADPYPEYEWDNLTRCVDWYVEQSCSLYVRPCTL